MATVKAKDLARICRTLSDLRGATLALANGDSERIGQAFDSASRDLAATLAPYNPKFDASRFMIECGATVKGNR
jgi:hypothetical protein